MTGFDQESVAEMTFCKSEPKLLKVSQSPRFPSWNVERARGSVLEDENSHRERGPRHEGAAHATWSRDEPCGFEASLEIL